VQPALETHTSKCPKCGKICENSAFGGTGFQFAGRQCNKQLHGFPDYENKVNKDAFKEGKEMEKMHDQYIKEKLKDDS